MFPKKTHKFAGTWWFFSNWPVVSEGQVPNVQSHCHDSFNPNLCPSAVWAAGHVPNLPATQGPACQVSTSQSLQHLLVWFIFFLGTLSFHKLGWQNHPYTAYSSWSVTYKVWTSKRTPGRGQQCPAIYLQGKQEGSHAPSFQFLMPAAQSYLMINAKWRTGSSVSPLHLK